MTEYRTIDAPEYQSQMCFNGDWSFCIAHRRKKPNLFIRTMQRLVLGIHWRDVE